MDGKITVSLSYPMFATFLDNNPCPMAASDVQSPVSTLHIDNEDFVETMERFQNPVQVTFCIISLHHCRYFGLVCHFFLFKNFLIFFLRSTFT